MGAVDQFNREKEENIKAIGEDKSLQELGRRLLIDSARNKYSYNFTWMGRPIIAIPQDMMAMQEIIWNVKPDLIIETGVAHGGSIIYYASLLEMMGIDGKVIGIDIDIRAHNRELIEKHPMYKKIHLIEGSSTDKNIVNEVRKLTSGREKVMVCLDSNHTHDHVYNELLSYSSFVTKDSYLVVFDTVVEDISGEVTWENRPWGKGNNPKTAVWEFLKENKNFEIDQEYNKKLLVSVAPDGYLKRIK